MKEGEIILYFQVTFEYSVSLKHANVVRLFDIRAEQRILFRYQSIN